MPSKITRRVAIGSFVAAAVACPFIVRALRRTRQIELGDDSLLARLRTRFEPALSFPREFDISHHDPFSFGSLSGPNDPKKSQREAIERFRSLPQNTQDTILETQRKYWKNFAQIDEIEFDCTNYCYKRNGAKETSHGNFEGHVRMKYGYGLEIVGKDAKGEHLHWIFNLDGDISHVAREVNLAGIMMVFFEASAAMPALATAFDQVDAVDADLPENPYLKNDKGDKYTVLSRDAYLKNPEIPLHIQGKTFYRRYYNQRTGIQEYVHAKSYQGRVFQATKDVDGRWTGSFFVNPKYKDPTVPLPELGESIFYRRTTEVEEGIFLPVECVHTSRVHVSGFQWRATYSNIRIRRV